MVFAYISNFLWLLARRILNFLRFELLVDKPQFQFFHHSCVLAVQELLAPLLARALFLGCTVYQSVDVQ